MTTVSRITVPVCIQARWVNCYYIHDSRPALIDTGFNTEAGLSAIKQGVEASGGRLENISRIILTHGHADHMGLAARLAEGSAAEVYIHRLDRSSCPGRDHHVRDARRKGAQNGFREAGVPENEAQEYVRTVVDHYDTNTRPIPNENFLQGGETFEFDSFELKSLHTPGHSAGSVCLINETDRTLFTGDALVPEIVANPTAEVCYPEAMEDYRALPSYLDSLALIGGLPVDRVLPGHGRPFTELRRRVRELTDLRSKRREAIIRYLRKRSAEIQGEAEETPFSVAKELFDWKDGREAYVWIFSVRSHLQSLADEGVVSVVERGGVLFYRLNSERDRD